MNRIIATIVLTITMLGALVMPASAETGVTPAPPETCVVSANDYALTTQTLVQTTGSLEQYKALTTSLQAQVSVQRGRAEAYKSQVARLKAKLAARR